MTSREQMAEKIATVQVRARRGVTGKVNAGDREVARAVLDAILPQVSTVAELQALNPKAVVVETTGRYSGEAWRAAQVDTFGSDVGWPLTVVWTPEVDR